MLVRCVPDSPNIIGLLDPVLLRQAWVIRAALEHGLCELPLLLPPEVGLAATLVAPASCTLAEIESGEFCGRREPNPQAAVGLRVFAALIGTRAALWPAPLLLATASPPSPPAFCSPVNTDQRSAAPAAEKRGDTSWRIVTAGTQV